MGIVALGNPVASAGMRSGEQPQHLSKHALNDKHDKGCLVDLRVGIFPI